MDITCYTIGADLLTYDTAERIRAATPAERRESNCAGDTGAFRATVSERTLRRNCPIWVRQYGSRR